VLVRRNKEWGKGRGGEVQIATADTAVFDFYVDVVGVEGFGREFVEL